MGHTRLGKIPKSKKWTSVVAIISDDNGNVQNSDELVNGIAHIASKTLEAAEGGLQAALNDIGLQYTFYLLTQIVLTSRTDNWQQNLAQLGIQLSSNSSFQDLSTEMQGSIDNYIFGHGKSTDISEMAQQAAGEALSELTSGKAVTLFGEGLDELKLAVRDLSTKKGFSELGQKFFGKFTTRFLNFYLSRITASHIGKKHLAHVGDVNRFDEALRLHCEQSAYIVRDFCGEWYSKTEYMEGINLNNTKGFIAVAIKKLQAELRQQGDSE